MGGKCFLVAIFIATTTAHVLNCDFEKDFCQWTNEATADQEGWVRQTGSTSVNSTGPSTDHTLGSENGFYAYLNASDGANSSVFQLISPALTIENQHGCLQFYYYKYGLDVADLSVYKVSNNGTGHKTTLWSMHGTLGIRWNNAKLNIGTGSDFVIIIEATQGSSYEGYIAIDDISYSSSGTCVPPLVTTAPSGTLSVSCTFEIDLCGFSQDQTDNFDWTRHSGPTSSVTTGPIADHSLNTVTGYYIYAEASSPRLPDDKARLESVLVPASPTCVHFWYSMHGITMGTLNIYIKTSAGLGPVVWTRDNEQGREWKEATVNVSSSNSGFTVVFEAVVGSGYNSDIALDDITITTGGCPHPDSSSDTFSVSCNFETDSCDFLQDQNDDFDWIRRSGTTTSYGTGPTVDHSLKTGAGHYIYVEASAPRSTGDKARLESGLVPASPILPICVNFWYNMYGYSMGTLNIYIKTSADLGPVVWTKKHDQGPEWKEGTINVASSSSGFTVVFEAVLGGAFTSDIALDDITITNGECFHPGTSDLSSLSCNFETTCQYHDLTLDSLNWILNSGPTMSSGTGPTADHTTGTNSGHYIYLESSSPAVQGDKAKLASPVVSTGSGYFCLNFWFNMFGADIGSLNIHIVDGTNDIVVWTRFGDQGDLWHLAQVSFELRSGYSQIIFEGVVGSSYQGDIALDDIKVTNTVCAIPSNTNSISATATTSAARIGDTGTSNLSGLNCSFETPCQYKDLIGDSLDWTLNSGAPSSIGTGPSFDHTTGTFHGKYIYIESSSPAKLGDNAKLASPVVSNRSGDYCLNFWYNMLGGGIGSLNIHIVDNTTDIIVWTKSGNQGSSWQLAQVSLQLVSRESQIVFEGVVGSDYQGDIALDDIGVTDGLCTSK